MIRRVTEISAARIRPNFHGTSSNTSLQNSVVVTSNGNRTNQQISLRKMQTNLNNKQTPGARGNYSDDPDKNQQRTRGDPPSILWPETQKPVGSSTQAYADIGRRNILAFSGLS
jgi:hypothetical protein